MPHVVITGASRGIGRELVCQYVDAGWRVTAGVRRPDAAALPPSARILALDVEEPASVAAFADAIDESVDVLLNNAGLFGPRPQTTADADPALWGRIFQVNCVAPVLVARALLDKVAAGDRRVLATVTSRMGSLAENDNGAAPMYRASKAAVNMAMQCLAFEVADRDLGVLLLHPGWVRTAMGTEAADLDAGASARGLRDVVDAFDPAERLAFRAWDGRDIPW